jgi:hypothetical protein
MSLGSGFNFGIGSGQATYNSGPADGNYPTMAGGVGMPNYRHNAVVVGFIVIAALFMLVTGVIALRASGEIVI